MSIFISTLSKRVPEKHLLLFYWLCQSLWLRGSQQTVENSYRDGNTRPLYLPTEKPACRSRSNSSDQIWNNRLVQIGRVRCQSCILSHCLFNLNAEYIMRNAGLDKTQAGIKTARRSINNLRYADGHHSNGNKRRRTKDPLDEDERRQWKTRLKPNIEKMKIMASGLFMAIDGKQWKQWQSLFSWPPKPLWMVTAAMKLKGPLLHEGKAMTNLDSVTKKQKHHFVDNGPYSQSYGLSSSHIWM